MTRIVASVVLALGVIVWWSARRNASGGAGFWTNLRWTLEFLLYWATLALAVGGVVELVGAVVTGKWLWWT